MNDFSRHLTKIPARQQAVKANCFHPTGKFVEFTKDEVEQSITERFEKIVRLYPQRLALKLSDHALTYEGMNRAANRIAHSILFKNGKRDEPVALLLGKEALPAAILGVLKTGKSGGLKNSSAFLWVGV